jgi:hypothetical protein
MFPFVIQMGEVVTDKELKFRQALAAMGLYDLSYWLSWHIYQSVMAAIAGFFIYAFGCIFQFRLFLKNDFGVLFLTFWLFGQVISRPHMYDIHTYIYVCMYVYVHLSL